MTDSHRNGINWTESPEAERAYVHPHGHQFLKKDPCTGAIWYQAPNGNWVPFLGGRDGRFRWDEAVRRPSDSLANECLQNDAPIAIDTGVYTKHGPGVVKAYEVLEHTGPQVTFRLPEPGKDYRLMIELDDGHDWIYKHHLFCDKQSNVQLLIGG